MAGMGSIEELGEREMASRASSGWWKEERCFFAFRAFWASSDTARCLRREARLEEGGGRWDCAAAENMADVAAAAAAAATVTVAVAVAVTVGGKDDEEN